MDFCPTLDCGKTLNSGLPSYQTLSAQHRTLSYRHNVVWQVFTVHSFWKTETMHPLNRNSPVPHCPLPLTTTILLTASMGLTIFRNLVYMKPHSVCPSGTGLNQGLKEVSAPACSSQHHSQQPRHGNDRHARGRVSGCRRALVCGRVLLSHEREGSPAVYNSTDAPGGHHRCVKCQEMWATAND